MSSFTGFPSGKVHLTPVPAQFFTELLPQIDDLGELKVTLYAIWHLDHQEGNLRYLRLEDFTGDTAFSEGFGITAELRESAIRGALEKACLRGSLIPAVRKNESLYFLNSPRGRAAAESLAKEAWNPEEQGHSGISLEVERPNIFTLYEKNIGPLTPILSQTLQEAEEEYPAEWIEEAIRTAVLKNARNWRYVEAILRSWKERGRDESNQRDTEKSNRRYIEGEYADFIEH